jgi:hypothetical protein
MAAMGSLGHGIALILCSSFRCFSKASWQALLAPVSLDMSSCLPSQFLRANDLCQVKCSFQQSSITCFSATSKLIRSGGQGFPKAGIVSFSCAQAHHQPSMALLCQFYP